MADKELLSVVITSYTMDRLKDIVELLHSIRVQTYSNIEIIFVAERSKALLEEIQRYATDNTATNMKVIFNDGEMGMSAARNLGIKNAQGDIIAFVDDDALPSPDWAEEIMKTYEDVSVIGVTGPASPLWQNIAIDWFPNEFDWILGCSGFSGILQEKDVRNVWGMNMSFRREAFDSCGLFLTTLGAKGGGGGLGTQKFASEETEFSIRVRRKTGKRILFNPKTNVQHRVNKHRLTASFIAKRAYSEGYTKAMLKRYYRDKDSGDKLLSVEYKLLKQILLNLVPRILRMFFTRPTVAYRQLRVVIIALSSVSFGYLTYFTQHVFVPQKAIADI
jgi:glycosyltransferase involved in cell wall biosynthesis